METLQRLRKRSRTVHVSPGETVFSEGDRSTTVYIVESGLLKVCKVGVDGKTSILALRRSGALVGEQATIDLHPRLASVVALTATELTAVPAEWFLDALETCPDLSMMLLHQFSARLRETSTHMLEYATADAPSRVASRLVALIPDDQLQQLEEAPAVPVRLKLPLSQAELAEWCGVSRETIVKALRELRTAGLIETARKTVTILDFDALHRRGLEAYYPL